MTPFARHSESGFGIFSALVLLAFIGFIAAAAMGTMRVSYAILGFVAALVVITVLAMIPDIIRYSKISSM